MSRWVSVAIWIGGVILPLMIMAVILWRLE
jgi:hypothetical protein